MLVRGIVCLALLAQTTLAQFEDKNGLNFDYPGIYQKAVAEYAQLNQTGQYPPTSNPAGEFAGAEIYFTDVSPGKQGYLMQAEVFSLVQPGINININYVRLFKSGNLANFVATLITEAMHVKHFELWSEYCNGLPPSEQADCRETILCHFSMSGPVAGRGRKRGQTIVDIAPPTVTKTELYRGTACGPAYDAVFHPFSRELILLADTSATNAQKKLCSVSVDATQPVPVLRVDLDVPLLPSAKGMKIGVTSESALVYVFLFELPVWFNDAGESALGLGPGESQFQTHAFCDQDGDGLFEVSYQEDALTIAALSDTIDWDGNYVGVAP